MMHLLESTIKWAVHGVISQAMAQGQNDRWIRKMIRKEIGVDYTLEEIEVMMQDWEDEAVKTAKEHIDSVGV